MQLVLEKRAERSNTIALVSPLIAIGADDRDHEHPVRRSSARTRSPRSASTSSIPSPTAIRCRKSR